MADLEDIISEIGKTESGKLALDFARKAGVVIMTDPKHAQLGSYDVKKKLITLRGSGTVAEDAVTLDHCLRYVQQGSALR